jgi:hypothetical protein
MQYTMTYVRHVYAIGNGNMTNEINSIQAELNKKNRRARAKNPMDEMTRIYNELKIKQV